MKEKKEYEKAYRPKTQKMLYSWYDKSVSGVDLFEI
jgi:hypothetical protein